MEAPFILFGFEHTAALFVVVLLIFLGIAVLQKLDSARLTQRFNPLLGVITLLWAIESTVRIILRGEFLLSEDLPLHLCGAGRYLVVAYLLMNHRQKFFDVLFYWITCGSLLALVFPDLNTGYPSGDYIIFFTSHGLPLFTISYLVLVQRLKPSRGSYRSAFLALNLYAFLIALPANLLVNGNYLYLFKVPKIDFEPIGILPPWPWYLLIFELFMYGVFRLAHYPFFQQPDLKEKKLLV